MQYIKTHRNDKMKTLADWLKNSLILCILYTSTALHAATNLADAPVFAANTVPGNVALVISAEFPTALGSAYTSAYSSAVDYIGYFDANKCYVYHTEANINKHYFEL